MHLDVVGLCQEGDWTELPPDAARPEPRFRAPVRPLPPPGWTCRPAGAGHSTTPRTGTPERGVGAVAEVSA